MLEETTKIQTSKVLERGISRVLYRVTVGPTKQLSSRSLAVDKLTTPEAKVWEEALQSTSVSTLEDQVPTTTIGLSL